MSTRDLLDRGCRCCPSELRSRAPGLEAFEPGKSNDGKMNDRQQTFRTVYFKECLLIGIRLWTGYG